MLVLSIRFGVDYLTTILKSETFTGANIHIQYGFFLISFFFVLQWIFQTLDEKPGLLRILY